MKLISTIAALLDRKTTLTLGISRSARGPLHAFVASRGQQNHTVLSAGRGVPPLVRLFAPPTAAADLGNAPVWFVTAELGKEDPESWMDRNEPLVIPTGAAPDQVVNDYVTAGGTIFSATVTTAARNAALALLADGISLQSLGAPLWCLAKLYGQQIRTPFVLWKIAADGSLLGLVKNGVLQNTVHCYVDISDMVQKSEESTAVVRQIVSSLCGDETEAPLVVFSPEPDFAAAPAISAAFPAFRQAPAIGHGLPVWCHEAYALAIWGNDGHRFLPLDMVRAAGAAGGRYNKLRSVARVCIVLSLCLLAFAGGTDAVFHGIERHYRAPMERVRDEGETIRAAEKRRDHLAAQLRDKLTFAASRSGCTRLFSGLQTAFPEGVWAESVSITELDTAGWSCDVQALAGSSSLISGTLDGISKIPGVFGAHLAYSEQVALPDKSRAIRFKITWEWR